MKAASNVRVSGPDPLFGPGLGAVDPPVEEGRRGHLDDRRSRNDIETEFSVDQRRAGFRQIALKQDN